MGQAVEAAAGRRVCPTRMVILHPCPGAAGRSEQRGAVACRSSMPAASPVTGEGSLTSLNAACPYFTMFPLSFPLKALVDAGPDDVVLDPFCGRGTTLYAARMCGVPATGIDINPVAVAIAEAKLADASPKAVAELARRLVKHHRSTSEPPSGEFWRLAYEDETLRHVAALRQGLLNCVNNDAAKLLRAIALGALHGPRGKTTTSYFSNQMPRTYATKPTSAVKFWTTRDLQPPAADVAAIIEKRATRFLAERPTRGTGRVLLGDARVVLRRIRSRFTRVVCSPPYLGMRTYLPDQWLRWWFLGGPPDVEYHLPGQIATADPDRLVQQLAETWTAIASRCADRAVMTIRFGALPSVAVEPSDLIDRSLRLSASGWRIVEERPAGRPGSGRRQSHQFQGESEEAKHEVDVVARFEP